MPKINLLSILAFLSILIAFGCKSEKAAWTAKNIPYQTFKLEVGRDTSIVLQSGAILKIKKNSFLGAKTSTVKLKVQEINGMEAVIKSRIATLSSDGKPLSTFYMVNLETEDEVRINPDAPVNLCAPATCLVSDISVYKGETDEDGVTWTKTDTIKEQPVIDRIAEGKLLFEQYCKNCHAGNLCDFLTGPPLACIEGDETVQIPSEATSPFASREWLLKFTKNSQAMIKSGDVRAVRLWQEYKPTLMNSFEGALTDDQIHQIYDYIKDRSSACKLCATMSDYYTFEEMDSMVEVFEKTERKSLNIDTSGLDIPASLSTEPAPKVYSFDIPDFGWYNIDRIIEPIDQIENFTVTTNRPNVYVNLVLPEYRMQLSLKEDAPGNFSFDYAKDGKVNLPNGAKGMLLARTDESDKELFYGGKEITVGSTNNSHALDLKPGSENELQLAIAQIADDRKLVPSKTTKRKGLVHCQSCPLYEDGKILKSE
jgi:mono/diheme cytochrome c family protein